MTEISAWLPDFHYDSNHWWSIHLCLFALLLRQVVAELCMYSLLVPGVSIKKYLECFSLCYHLTKPCLYLLIFYLLCTLNIIISLLYQVIEPKLWHNQVNQLPKYHWQFLPYMLTQSCLSQICWPPLSRSPVGKISLMSQ